MIYTMRRIVQAFQVGSSTVVTLPKELGIAPGQRFQIKKAKKTILLQPRNRNITSKEAAKIVKRLSGGLNLKYHPTPEEINRELDKQYEDMLPRR